MIEGWRGLHAYVYACALERMQLAVLPSTMTRLVESLQLAYRTIVHVRARSQLMGISLSFVLS